VARLANSLEIRFIEEESFIAAALVDVLSGSDYVVNNPAQRGLEIVGMDYAERISRQNYPANCSPGLGLVEFANWIVRTLNVESFPSFRRIDRVRTKSSSWHLVP
jgi:hypothetical protein